MRTFYYVMSIIELTNVFLSLINRNVFNFILFALFFIYFIRQYLKSPNK